MAVNSGTIQVRSEPQVVVPQRWKQRDVTSPERNKIWIEPPPKMKNTKSTNERKVVSIVYYLSRNGQLEHPHFMEITLSSTSDGLYLSDVIKRLDVLRGKGMATLYSWSSKRSYKNGFVWHDLSDNNFIYPTHGQEYVLKGSELLLNDDYGSSSANTNSKYNEISSSLTSNGSLEAHKTTAGAEFSIPVTHRRNQSWSSIDLHEYKVYKTDSHAGANAGKTAAADASTQTNDKVRRRSKVSVKEEEIESVELSRDEVSPPPSDSSPETLDSMIKSEGRLILCPEKSNNEIVPNERPNNNRTNGRMKASSVLMQLISCGAVSFKDSAAMAVKEQGFSLLSHYKSRLPTSEHGGEMICSGKYVEESLMENPSFERLRLEDKEYFSGSLIQTKKDDFLSLKRSSSYNADRSSQLELAVKEIEGVRTKCIPRKSKTVVIKREADNRSANGNGSCDVHC